MKERKKDMLNENTKKILNLKLPCKVKLLSSSVPVYTGAGFEYFSVGSVSDRDLQEIMEVKEGKNENLWGNLRSGAGWIPLTSVEVLETDAE